MFLLLLPQSFETLYCIGLKTSRSQGFSDPTHHILESPGNDVEGEVKQNNVATDDNHPVVLNGRSISKILRVVVPIFHQLFSPKIVLTSFLQFFVLVFSLTRLGSFLLCPFSVNFLSLNFFIKKEYLCLYKDVLLLKIKVSVKFLMVVPLFFNQSYSSIIAIADFYYLVLEKFLPDSCLSL